MEWGGRGCSVPISEDVLLVSSLEVGLKMLGKIISFTSIYINNKIYFACNKLDHLNLKYTVIVKFL